MTSVVQHSLSIASAFISTVDHLPCDVIRSLWFIQWCNLSVEKEKDAIHEVLLAYQDGRVDKQTMREALQNAETRITRLNNEAQSELRALHYQLTTHQITLADEVAQLQSLAKVNAAQEDTNEKFEALRAQLLHHYRENPLISQKEALIEQKERKKSGLKLVLKLKQPRKLAPPPVPGQKRGRGRPRKYERVELVQPPLPPQEVYVAPVKEDEDNAPYCFCRQPSSGDMIACDNEDSCPNGEWFHYKCVGLLNRVEALKYATGKEKWFCSNECRETSEARATARAKRKRRRW